MERKSSSLFYRGALLSRPGGTSPKENNKWSDESEKYFSELVTRVFFLDELLM
jgi:hypothetical protein